VEGLGIGSCDKSMVAFMLCQRRVFDQHWVGHGLRKCSFTLKGSISDTRVVYSLDKHLLIEESQTVQSVGVVRVRNLHRVAC